MRTRRRRGNFDFIILGGNPGTRTSYDVIVNATQRAKKIIGAPQVPMSEHEKFVKDLIDTGADIHAIGDAGLSGMSSPDFQKNGGGRQIKISNYVSKSKPNFCSLT